MTDPIPRSRPEPPSDVARIRQLAFRQGQTSAADAPRQARAQPLQFHDPFIYACSPKSRELRPVRTLRYPIRRQFGQFEADFIQRKSDSLREHNERNPAQHCLWVPAVPSARSFRLNQTLVLVEPECRGRYATAARNLADGNQSSHAQKISDFSTLLQVHFNL
jgi:hypothetical protein